MSEMQEVAVIGKLFNLERAGVLKQFLSQAGDIYNPSRL